MRDAAPTFVRWLWIWITVGALVVVVVIGFLIGITGALSSIDDNLFEADRAVGGAGADVKPLPDHIKDINQNLTHIDAALKPIPDQAVQIRGSLVSIQGSLQSVDSSLVDTSNSLKDTSASLVNTSSTLGNITSLLVNTSGSLVNTSGTLGGISSSLVNTSGTLQTVSRSLVSTTGTLGRISGSLVDTANTLVRVRTNAAIIDSVLKDAQSENSLGTHGIWRRVRFLNGGAFRRGGNDEDTSLSGPNNNPNGLSAVKGDTGNILGGLQQVNRHLTSICQAPVLGVAIPGFVQPGPNC